MVSSVVQQQLNALLQNYGRNSLSDPDSLESLLKDKIGEESQDAALLITSLRSGIPQALAGGAGDGAALARSLREETFITPGAAESAVKAWAEALNIVISFDETVIPLSHDAPPPLPHIEVVEPPVPVPTTPEPWSPRSASAPRKSNTWIFVAATILILGLAAGIAGYLSAK